MHNKKKRILKSATTGTSLLLLRIYAMISSDAIKVLRVFFDSIHRCFRKHIFLSLE